MLLHRYHQLGYKADNYFSFANSGFRYPCFKQDYLHVIGLLQNWHKSNLDEAAL